MEKAIVVVLDQFPMKEREWTRSDGTVRVIKSVELRLRDASDEFYCEATDEQAERLAKTPLKLNSFISAECRLVCRKWTTEAGVEMHATSIRLLNYIEL